MAIISIEMTLPVLAAPSEKAAAAFQLVKDNPTNESIESFIKIMLKEYKKANRQKNYDDAADYLKSALYFLNQTPNKEEYKKAIKWLEETKEKQGAESNYDSRLEVAKNTYLEKKYFAAAYDFSELLNEGYKEDVCYEYLGDISKELKTEDIAFLFYKQAVLVNPDNLDAKYKYANALLNKGMESDAIYHFEDVINRTNSQNVVNNIIEIFKTRLNNDPDNENNYGILGLAYQKLGQYDKTYQYLKHSLILNPNDIFLRYYLANLLFNIKEYSFADEIYSEILEENPYESQIRISRAKAYAAMGNSDKALRDYRIVLAMYPDSIQAQYGIYGLLKSKMPIDKIIASFYPLEPNYKLNADGFDSLGYLANQMGSTNDAITFFEQSYKLNPKSETVYVELYKAYQLTGRNDKAKEILQKGYKLFPNNQEIIDLYSSTTSSKTDEKNNVALSYLNEGEYQKAIAVYNQIEPKNAQTYEAIANCYRQLGDLNNAILNYKKSLEIDSKNPETHYSLGVAYLEAKNNKLAKEAFNHAIYYDPKNLRAKKMLSYLDQEQIGQSIDVAYSYYERGDYENAIKQLDAAAKAFPYDPKAFYYRGLTKTAMGNYAGAVSDFRKTIENDRTYVEAYFYLAENLERINKKKEALYMYEKFLGADKIDENMAQRAQSRVLDLGERYY